MAAFQVIQNDEHASRKQYFLHPLSPLTGAEIITSANILRKHWPANTDLRFKAIMLVEPEKTLLIQHLDSYRAGDTPAKFPRKSFACYYIRNTVSLYGTSPSAC